VSDSEFSRSRHAKEKKTELSDGNEYFLDKCNVEIGHYGQTLNIAYRYPVPLGWGWFTCSRNTIFPSR